MLKDDSERLVLGFLGTLVAFWLMAHSMSSNGADDPRNFAWVLISTIRWVLTAVAVCAGIGIYFHFTWAHEEELEKKRQHEESERLRAIEREAEHKDYLLRRAEEKKREAALELKREKERQKEEDRQKEEALRKEQERRERSPEAAVSSALDDFI